MRAWRMGVVIAVVATSLSGVVNRLPAAQALTSCGASTEVDINHTYSDGETTVVRMMRPTGCTKPGGGWPLIVNLHGWGGNRCTSALAYYTRAQIVADGFAVASFAARGNPVSAGLGEGGCTAAQGADDMLNDDGNDVGGPRDQADISEVITVADGWNPTGCSSCVDGANAGVVGGSYGGFRALQMGVNDADHDSRIKAVVAARPWLQWGNIAKLSNNGSTFQPTAHYGRSHEHSVWWNTGLSGKTTEAHLSNQAELTRFQYLAQTGATLPTATRDYWDARYLVDDDNTTADGDPAVDKVDTLTNYSTPTFIQVGWLDGAVSIFNHVAYELYSKLDVTNKFLYVGSCSHGGGVGSGDPCHGDPPGSAANGLRMRLAVHNFLDRFVRPGQTNNVPPALTGGCTDQGKGWGPCVMYDELPAWNSVADNPWTDTDWVHRQSISTTWLPTTPTEAFFFQNNSTMLGAPEAGSGTSCTEPTGCHDIANEAALPFIVDVCQALTYGTAEREIFEISAADVDDGEIVDFTADLWLSSLDTTRLQVHVEFWDVNGTNTEFIPIVQGEGRVMPVKRDAVAGANPTRFVFHPTGSAWTIASGRKLWVVVSTKYKQSAMGEPIPGTVRLYHNGDYQSKITLTYA